MNLIWEKAHLSELHCASTPETCKLETKIKSINAQLASVGKMNGGDPKHTIVCTHVVFVVFASWMYK